MSNQEEFVAGTNPTNALSLLRLSVSSTNSGLLEFVAQTNISYAVQYRTNLESSVWRNATNILPGTQVRTIQVPAPSPVEPRRFIRVMTPPEP